MAKRIEGITIELNGDTRGLQSALGDVDKASKNTNKELKQIENTLKFNPGNVELLTQQQEVLGRQIQNTSERLNILKQAQAEVEAQFKRGNIDAEQYRAFQRELIKTESQLDGLRSKLDKSIQAKVDTTSLSKFKNALKDVAVEAGNVAKEVGTALGSAATGVTAGLVGLTVGTSDLNTDLARLRTNADIAGAGLEEAEEAFRKLYEISGEADSSVEAVSQLLASGFKGEALTGILDEISGAAIRFSDTLNVEGISDGLQETLALGTPAGQFAELLDRSKVSLDDFEEGLAKNKTEAEKLQFVLETLSGVGLSDTKARYEELNPEVQKAAEANAELQLALSDLSLILTPLVTQVVDLIERFVEFVTENPKLVTTFALLSAAATALFGALAFVAPIVQAIIPLWPALTAAITPILGPLALAVGAIVAVGTALTVALTQSEGFRDGIGSVFGGIVELVKDVFGFIADFISDRIQFIKDYWAQNGSDIQVNFETVLGAIQKVFEVVFPIIQNVVKGVIDTIGALIDSGLAVVLGLVIAFSKALQGDWEGAWNAIKDISSSILDTLSNLFRDTFGGKISKTITDFVSNAKRFISDLANSISGKFTEIVNSTTTKFTAVKNAIVNPIKSATDTIKGFIDNIKGFFSGLNLKIPEIKLPRLPRIRINGEFGLNPPRVPSFEFYAKGGIMTKPTAFGVNPNTGATMVGGEKGPEGIIPLNAQTLGAIGRGIADQMGTSNNAPSTIVVQSVLDGRIIAETITPLVSQNQNSATNLRALSRGVQL